MSISTRTLVINRSYEPIHTVSARKAITLVVKEVATIVLPPPYAQWEELSWEDWKQLEPREGESIIKAVSQVIKVPEIIKITEYGDNPARKVKISRRAIHKRDNNTCQYCGCVPAADEITIDHILPKSRGGKTEWGNVVLACLECNRVKDNKTPEEARMKLLSVPKMLVRRFPTRSYHP